MIVVVIVSFITLASDPSQVPWVLLVFIITQQIEGNVVLPWVMKGQAEIPEALLIIVMLFFGFWFGLLGVFIAPPLVAVMICLYRNLYHTGHRDAPFAGHQSASLKQRSEIRWTPKLRTVMIPLAYDRRRLIAFSISTAAKTRDDQAIQNSSSPVDRGSVLKMGLKNGT